MLEMLAMPTRQDVKNAIIKTLFKHNGSIKEFAAGEAIVAEIADLFSLNNDQREAVLERIYRKENRIVKTPLWHRLLYRAANELAKEKLVTNPSDTALLTNKREWLLTEKGIDRALELLNIPLIQKETLPVQSFEIQKEVKRIKERERPLEYVPFEAKQKTNVPAKMINIRSRSFRKAVIETYDYTCCICGLKITSPNALYWEVEAAHIVPHNLNGKDDIWNGIALCRLHHWAFDVGWFSFSNKYRVMLSSQMKNIPNDFGKINGCEFFRNSLEANKRILLPEVHSMHPHENAVEWHRNNVFCP
ncbi:MAG: HNH endonuclease [Treponema sp.]|jgi:hypothetical protein|nr:HNH endonuclease [Treponema sp.]